MYTNNTQLVLMTLPVEHIYTCRDHVTSHDVWLQAPPDSDPSGGQRSEGGDRRTERMAHHLAETVCGQSSRSFIVFHLFFLCIPTKSKYKLSTSLFNE